MVEGTRRFEPALALAALLVVASLGATLTTLRRAPAVDFYHFWLVGQAVEAGEVRDVYAPEARVDAGERAYQRALMPGVGEAQRRAATKFRRLETTATPFLYASFFPFVTGDYDYDRVAFGAFGIFVFAAAVGGLAWRLAYGATALLLLLGLTFLAFEPFASDVRVGNVNRLQFGILVAYGCLLWGVSSEDRFRPTLAGVWMGLAAMWKPNLAFPVGAVLFFWSCRDRNVAWRAHLAGLVVGAGAAFVVGSVFFGTPLVWAWWADAAMNLPRDFPVPVEDGNFAPLRVLEQGFGIGLGVAWTVSCLVLLGLVLRRAAASHGRDEPLADELVPVIGIGCAVSLLASPLAWLHYYLLSMLLVLWVLRPDPPEGPLPRVYRVVGLTAVVAVSMGPVLEFFVVTAPYRWAAFGNGGLILLLLLAVRDLLLEVPNPGPSRLGVTTMASAAGSAER